MPASLRGGHEVAAPLPRPAGLPRAAPEKQKPTFNILSQKIRTQGELQSEN